jgi:hypothetical protein
MARRSGRLVVGFEKVRARLKAGADGVLVAACDGAPDGRHKLARYRPGKPIVDHFTAAELGAMLGRGDAVHAWVEAGPLAGRLLLETARLDALRAGVGSRDQRLNGR